VVSSDLIKNQFRYNKSISIHKGIKFGIELVTNNISIP